MMNPKTWSDYSQYIKNDALSIGFTNRHFPFKQPDDRAEFAKVLHLQSENIVKPIQIHSNIVEIVKIPSVYDNIDGIITSNKDLVLSIQVADCIPIFIYDKTRQIFGLIHAGWKGAAQSIIDSIVTKLIELDSNVKDLKVILGPSIRQCCYEVGPEVAGLFTDFIIKKSRDDRSYLDLQGYVIADFEKRGVENDQIADINICTCCSNNYYSYRRDGKKAGRMIAMMGFKRDK